MADSAVDITAGTGTSIDTRTEATNGHHRQVVVLGDPATNAGVAPVDGVLGLTINFSTRPTVAIIGNIPAAGGSLTAFQGSAPWLVTMATIPVQTNVTGYALESGGNLDSIITTLNNIKTKTDNLDVTLGSRLASGGTLPITGTINALNAGGSLTAFQGGGAWLTTLATLPVVANINNSSLPVTQSGTWTVQPGNTPNTTAWLVTMATIPVVATVNVTPQVTVTAIQGDPGTKAWLATLATLPVVTNVTGYALEAGNLATIVTTLNSIKSKTDNLDVTLGSRLGSGATLPITGTINTLAAGGSLTVFQGGNPWLMTQATLPVVVGGSVNALGAGGSLSAFQAGNWTVQPGNTPNTIAWLVTFATIPVVTSVSVGDVNQGTAGSSAWLMTLATLPVVGDFTVSSVGQGNSGSQAWLTTLATLPVVIGTPPVTQSGTWTVQPGNTPNTVGWLTTQATLPVVANINNATIAVTQSGMWDEVGINDSGNSITVDATNLDIRDLVNTDVVTAELSAVDNAVLDTIDAVLDTINAKLVTGTDIGDVTINNSTGAAAVNIQDGGNTITVDGTVAATQSGVWNVFSSLASGTNIIAGGQYLPTLASLSSMAHTNLKTDLFSNLMVNTNVPLPNSTRFSRFLTFASYASIMAAPGAGRRLVIREMDFSGNATLTVELYEDHAGTPARVWGPHYFLPYAGFIKPTCYIPITANKSLGINITGSAFNSTLDIRIETENV